MEKNTKAIKFCAIILAMAFAGAPIITSAQEGLTIKPASIEERADPGQTLPAGITTIRITNIGSEQRTLYMYARDIVGLSPEGFPVFAEPNSEVTEYEMSSWIQLPKEPVILGPKETKEIPFTIKVPEQVSPGGHFAGVFFSNQPLRPELTGVGVGYEVGSIISLRISGEIFEEAQIREFRTDKNIYSRPEVEFTAKIENLGNVLVRPRGPIDIENFMGKKVATLVINESNNGVFPKSTREFKAVWKGSGLSFGRYQATISPTFGEDGKKTISGALSFWVLPLNIILGIGGGLLLLIFAIGLYVRLAVRSRVAKLAGQGSAPNPELLHYQPAPFSRLALLTAVTISITLMLVLVMFFLLA